MKYLIVQSHCRSAFFHCLHLILDCSSLSEVLTIQDKDENLEIEGELYKFIGIPFHHLDVSVEHHLTSQDMMDIEYQIRDFLDNFIANNKWNKITIVIPINPKDEFCNFIKSCFEKNISLLRYYPEAHCEFLNYDFYKLLYSKDVSEILDIKEKLAKIFYNKSKVNSIEKIYINEEQQLPF